jgi:hypothetical protein
MYKGSVLGAGSQCKEKAEWLKQSHLFATKLTKVARRSHLGGEYIPTYIPMYVFCLLQLFLLYVHISLTSKLENFVVVNHGRCSVNLSKVLNDLKLDVNFRRYVQIRNFIFLFSYN